MGLAFVFERSVSLYFLVGAFNPFTFKVIIRYICSYWHFLNCFGFVFVGLSFHLCLLSIQVPLIFVVDFPGGSDGKASVYNVRDLSSIPGLLV